MQSRPNCQAGFRARAGRKIFNKNSRFTMEAAVLSGPEADF